MALPKPVSIVTIEGPADPDGNFTSDYDPNPPLSETDRSQVAFYYNADSGTTGAAPPFSFFHNGPTISTDFAYSGSKSIKVPIVSGSEQAGGSAYFWDFIPEPLKRFDSVNFSLRVRAPSNAVFNAGPGFIKFFRFRNGTEGSSFENKGAIYTLLEPDGEILSYYEGFPDNMSQALAPAGSGFELEDFTTFEHHVTLDTVAQEHGGTAVQRFYRNGVLLFERTDQATMLNVDDEGQTFGFIDFWNDGALFTGFMYVDDFTLAVKTALRDDTIHMATDADGNKYIGV